MAKENTLSVDFTWMPEASQLEELRANGKDSLTKHAVVRSFRQYIAKLLQVKIVVKDAHPIGVSYMNNTGETEEKGNLLIKQSISTVLGYLESLYIVSCDIIIESDMISYKRKLIELLCKREFIKESPEFWTTMDISFLTGPLLLQNYEAYSLIELEDFGLGNFVGLNTFVQHFDSSTTLSKCSPFKITQVKVKIGYEKFTVYFIAGNSLVPFEKKNLTTHSLFKMELSYASLHRLLICDAGKKNCTLYLHFLQSPLLLVARHKKTNIHKEDNLTYINFDSINDSTEWFRVIDLYKDCPSNLKCEFSMNSVLRMRLCTSQAVYLSSGRAKSVYTFLNHLMHQFCKNLTPLFTPMQIISASNKIHINLSSDQFRCFYALKCFLTRSHELVDQLQARDELNEVNAFFQEKAKENPAVLAEVLTHIYNQMDQGCVVMFTPTMKVLYNKLTELKNVNSELGKDKIAYIKKAFLMPTHVRFHPAQPQLYNRILRNSTGHLLRVSIRDCDMSLINLSLKNFGPDSKKYKADFLNLHIKRVLMKGIKLGPRRYEYFGMSSSQLRSHSVWCYSKGSDNRNVDEVRRDVGDLDQIQEVPKFMARLGQSFSQAVGRIRVPQECTNVSKPELDVTHGQKEYMSEEEEDEVGGRDESNEESSNKKFLTGKYFDPDASESNSNNINGNLTTEDETLNDPYVFSDGIGRMSQEIANQVYKKLSLEKEAPSAVQIRYAGCKGMLVVDPTMTGNLQISFRESMRKYESKDDSLEILKISKPRIVHLNRQFITILEQKGIVKETFLRLQRQMIHNLIKGMFYDENARDILNANTTLREINYEQLHQSGISFTKDPFFRSIILAIFRNKISLLRRKSRIALPEDSARNMFGVLDETKTLNYNEVFVQYTEFGKTTTKVLEGAVVVTKSPMLHIGDVRKFTAVNVKSLHHIRDCIVFPAKGSRPHPDEMAGSDLDGDEYMVTWLDELIFNQDNSPPMHYSLPKKKPEQTTGASKPIEASEQLDHFFNYILNDTVGQLANAHLARADYEKNGVRSETCTKIAKKHAKAVDFAKTGRRALMTWKERTSRYPDFMEKYNRGITYLSKKALGYLYRNCKTLEISVEATTDRMEFKLDDNLKHSSWKKFEKSATKTYQQYSKKIELCLKAYCMENEGEFISGNIVQNTMVNEEFRNLLELLEHEVTWLFQNLEEEFFAEFGGKPKSGEYTEDMLIKASAWYVTSYTGEKFGSTRYYGLPWVVSDVLAKLKMRNQQLLASVDNLYVKKASFVEEAIDKANQKRLDFSPFDDSDDAESRKCFVLDDSRTILDDWFRLQEKSFIHGDIAMLKKCMNEEFCAVTQKLLCCDNDYLQRLLIQERNNKVFSPGHYVLSTLIRISEMGTGHGNLSATFHTSYQELGLAAWITLIRLACSLNMSLLGFKCEDPAFFQVPEDTVWDMILINFSQPEAQEKYRDDPEGLRRYFLDELKMQDITFHPYKCDKEKFILQVTVQGTRYSVDRLREMIVRPDFMSCIVESLTKSNLCKALQKG